MHGVVMVVDDDLDIREAMAYALGALGYRVEAAANGQEALDILSRTVAPCLIILDLMMPVMNGWQFREQMLSRPGLATVPVVVVSAAANVEQTARELAIERCLRKPVQFAALEEVAQRYCG